MDELIKVMRRSIGSAEVNNGNKRLYNFWISPVIAFERVEKARTIESLLFSKYSKKILKGEFSLNERDTERAIEIINENKLLKNTKGKYYE